jgi:V/A-type H+-transporting ATPase subunit I
MRPLLLDREHAVIAAMLAAVGVGFAHIVLGLVLGIVSSAHGHESRLALSRAVQLLMLFLIVLALLAAVRVLPGGLFTPFAIAAVVGFPVLLLLEGIVAPIEFFSTLSSVLSYVRIMALGTASVLLAAVANRMAGVFGSAIVGVLFALLFHLVNFALG